MYVKYLYQLLQLIKISILSIPISDHFLSFQFILSDPPDHPNKAYAFLYFLISSDALFPIKTTLIL